MATRKPYPSDVSDEEWAFVAPYLALVREDAPQREHDLREVLNGLRWIVRTGSAWRYMPHDLPPWEAVYQQTQRWLKAGVFEEMIHDLRVLLRLSKGHELGAHGGNTGLSHAEIHSRERPSGRLRRTQGQEGLQGACGGGHFGTTARPAREPANEDDREEVKKLSEEIQQATAENVEIAYVDQGYTGERASELAAEHGIRLEVVKHKEAKRGFVLLPRRWVVERDFAWASRFRRLVKDYERLPETVAGLHFVAFACLFLQQATGILVAGS